MALRFKYMSWNMKNLSSNSIKREYYDFFAKSKTENLTGYVNVIRGAVGYGTDILGIIEVTARSGPAAVKALTTELSTTSGVHWSYYVTQYLTYKTAGLGENNAMLAKNQIGTKVTKFIRQENFPSVGFQNRVPVLFELAYGTVSGPGTMTVEGSIQMITWHAPAPAAIDAESEIKGLSAGIDAMIKAGKIDTSKPLLIAGDFNFDTDPASKKFKAAWNYLYKSSGYFKQFTGLANGKYSTLVKKDPAARVVPVMPTSYGDLLANAYDNIIINESHLENKGVGSAAMPDSVVQNHIELLVAETRAIFKYDANQTPQEIRNANKISDHLAVIVDLETK